MPFPVTINGNTYNSSDFSPYGYVTAFPNIMSDLATVAAGIAAAAAAGGVFLASLAVSGNNVAVSVYDTATYATGVGGVINLDFKNSSSTQRTGARIETAATTGTNGAENADLYFSTMRAGSVIAAWRMLANGSLVPHQNDGAAIGSASLSVSDIFFATGAVLNFSNGDLTLTHATGLLTLNGNLTLTNDKKITISDLSIYYPAVASGSSTFFIGNGGTYWSHTPTVDGREGDYNVLVGMRCGLNMTTAYYTTGMGYETLEFLTTGEGNSGFGEASLHAVTTGIENTGLGLKTLNGVITSNYSTAVGALAGFLLSGEKNTTVGAYSLTTAVTGTVNTALGYNAGPSLTSGSNNLFLGAGTGGGITTGSNNTIVGGNVTGLSASLASNIIVATGAGAIKWQYNSGLTTITGELYATTKLHIQRTDIAGTVAVKIGYAGGGSEYGMILQPTADTTTAIQFNNAAGTSVGSITVTNAATAYNTSSDARLKTKKKMLEVGDLFDHVEMWEFDWKHDGQPGVGPMAQDLHKLVPLAVYAGDDDDKNNPRDKGFRAWSWDAGKMMPHVAAELKALRARVAKLESMSVH